MSERNEHSAVAWAMKNHSVVLLVVCCLLVFGVVGLAKMNKNEFPDFTIRQGLVIAVYPGKTVSEVEEQLTKPLEDFIFTYKEVCKAKTKSFSRYGLSVIQIELNADLEDKGTFWNTFKHGIDTFKGSLPADVLAVEVDDDFGDTSAMLLTLESDDKTYRELQLLMDGLEDRLRGIEEVGRMKVIGMQKEQVSVYIDNARLSLYGMTNETLAVSLFAKGFSTMGGSVHTGGYNSPIYVSPSMNVVADVENLIVYSSPTGQTVRLKDIATVKREYPTPSSFITNNSKKCLLLSIEMKQGRNITQMGSQIDRVLRDYEATLPSSVTLNKITDQPKVVQASVVEFLKELLIAVVAVMIVVLLLLPWRVATIASATIPITIFIALGLFYAFNIELNTVTLAALIVTLGMIVDNSIVIIDAYVDDLKKGVPPQRAAIDSAQHFFKGIVTATLAISITFFPLLITLDGMFGDFIKAFPWAITIVLAVSLAVAELLVPYLLYRFIREPVEEPEQESNKQSMQGKFDNWLQARYNALIDRCFAAPRTTLVIALLSIILAICLFPLLPMRLMPTAERDQFAVEIYLPTGTDLATTTLVADSLERIMQKDDRVLSIASFKGTSSPRFQTGYAPQFPGENYAQFIVNTRNNKATVALLDEYAAPLHDAFPEAYIRFKQLAYGVEENAVEVRLSGFDKAKLLAATDTLITLMRQNKDLWIVRADINEPLMKTQVSLDDDKSAMLGASTTTVNLALASRYTPNGLPIATLWDGDYDISVCLMSPLSNASTINDLSDELIPVSAGLRSVPLRSIASLEQSYEIGQMPHRNGIPTITIKADVCRGKNVLNVTRKLMKTIKNTELDDDVEITFGGEYESTQENLPKIYGALAISVVIIFFLLLAHYKSVSTSLLLLFSLALTLFGTVMSIVIAHINFSLTSFLGIISLMGILVRNAIIMFDYANELLQEQQTTIREAVLMSAKRRMHPIFLTSMAASMGVIPMILSGSGLWEPMGVVIFYGTLITMCFILTILPIAYWKIKDNLR